MGCHLLGRTESNMTDVTRQQQQWHLFSGFSFVAETKMNKLQHLYLTL